MAAYDGRMLSTPWSAAVDRDAVLQEYPRPQLVRDPYLNLNGEWDYAVSPVSAVDRPPFDQRILVPFPPEAPLSGVGRVLQPDEHAWYRRTFRVPTEWTSGRIVLHFGAVDQDCAVWIDGLPAGEHRGGMLPFSLDITDLLTWPEHELVVRVRDVTDTSYRARGKQSLKPGGIWYTPSSGIWQTVWCELVPDQHVRSLTWTPLPATDEVEVVVEASAPGVAEVSIVGDGGARISAQVPTGAPTRIHIPDARRWTPDDPFLHDVHLRLGDDTITSYFGMRSVELGRDAAGRARVLLNGEPLLMRGLLDQGYWSDGLVTAPTDEALAHDVRLAKLLGFNTLRKHGKIEPLRWYHHCDVAGILVWQDIVNGGERQSRIVREGPNLAPVRRDDRKHRPFGRADAQGREEYLRELDETVALLRSAPSVVVWVPFNEGWGQFESLAVAERLRAADPSRLVDHASGWYDQGGGDFTSRHSYLRPYQPDDAEFRGPRAVALTEYGGYSHSVPGHSTSSREFGYKSFRNRGKFELAWHRLHRDHIGPAIEQGLSAYIYTQVSDVESETNGLITYDRQVLKVDPARVLATNAAMEELFRRSLGESPRPIHVAETELTQPRSLTLPDGSLDPASVGWSRRPLLETDGIGGLRGVGRNKRWEHWAVTTPTHVLALTIAHLDYACVCTLYTLVRDTGETIVAEKMLPMGGGVELPGTLGEGRAYAKFGEFLLRADEVPSGTRLRGRAGRVAFDIVAHRPSGHESLAVVVPWSERTFQYTVKDVARPATGSIWIDDQLVDISGPDSFATLDHGRGRWPSTVQWQWGVGAGRSAGRILGLQLGGTWTDGSGSTENAVLVGGRLHKISQELLWSFDRDDPMRPWRVDGDGIALEFRPFHVRRARTDLKLLSNDTVQPFGHWYGQVDTPDVSVRLDGLTGWAEDVRNRW